MSMPAVSVPAPPPALSDDAEELAQGALAKSTKELYASILRQFQDWLAEQGRELSDGSLSDYMAERFRQGLAPGSCSLILAAVKSSARLSGHPLPDLPQCRRVLAGIRRAGAGRGLGQVAGLQWAEADAVAAVAAQARDPRGLRDAALIALASDCLLRVSEAVAVQVADLAAEPDGSGRLTVHRSKTDQEGRGTVLYVGPPTMRRIAAWREAGAVHGGPLFRRVRAHGRVQSASISCTAARWIIQARARAAGFGDRRVSGHSLRVGSAQSLAVAGAGLVEMQTAGRWSSPSMPATYCRGQLAGRGAVARLRHSRG